MAIVSSNAPKVTFSLPWHQLERYSSHGGGDNALDNILQANPKGLFYLNYIVANFYTEVPKHLVTMQLLQVLQLHTCNHSDRLAALLDQLVLPSLVELHLRGAFKREHILFTRVKNLVARSNCFLSKLELDEGDTDISTFTQLLSLTPTLEHLDITRPPDDMLTTLILDHSLSDPILPKLSSLTVEIGAKNTRPDLQADGYACNMRVLRAVLKSRMIVIEPPRGSFHKAGYFKTLTEFKVGCRNGRSKLTRIWDFQERLEGRSSIPAVAKKQLREWQEIFHSRVRLHAFGMGYHGPGLMMKMDRFLREETFELSPDILHLLIVSIHFQPPGRQAEHFGKIQCRGLDFLLFYTRRKR